MHMAKQMPYTDSAGNQLPASYWRLMQVILTFADQGGSLVFYGYRDQAARTSRLAPIGTKQYALDTDAITAIQALVKQTGDLQKACYQWATQVNDPVPDNAPPGSVPVPFFKNAAEV
jgi:hypothetical protein